MQITFDVGYTRWVADVSGRELEALTALFAKSVKCHDTWGGTEERKSGVLAVDREEKLDMDIKIQSSPLTLRDWVEPPKPEPEQPAAKPATAFKVPQVVTPDIRDFMDEQLASPTEAVEGEPL